MSRPLPPPVERHAHFLVVQTAREMAHEMFDQLMMDNTLYAQWKAQCPSLTPRGLERRFVRLMTPKLLGQARSTLASMLALPGDQNLKDTIYDAIVKDNVLIRGRGASRQKLELPQ